MTNHVLAAKAQKLKDKGLSQAQIARVLIYSKSTICRLLGGNFDVEQWEAEHKAAVEFFGDMTPQQEYSEHIKKRNEARDKFGEIE